MASNAELLAADIAAGVPTTAGSDTGIAVKVRKAPVMLDGESAPMIVVCIARDGPRERLWATKDGVKYLGSATLITTGGHKAANNTGVQQWQESSELALNAASTYTHGTINEVWPSSKMPFDRGAMKATLNYTTVAVLIEVLETRTH